MHHSYSPDGLLLILCTILIMNEAVQASSSDYCFGGGQLAGVIFGSILGTIIVIAIAVLAVIYFKSSAGKGCNTVKEAQFDEALSNEGAGRSNIRTPLDSLNSRHGQHYSNHEYDHDQNGRHRQHEPGERKTGHSIADEILDKLTKSGSLASNDRTPHKLLGVNNSHSRNGSSEYRMKKKRSSVFSSWWSHHTSSNKRAVSHSTESLNSVNEVVRVALKSRDFNGLGFNICGNLRDGIFVKSLSNRGPAKESGNVHEGDRILSVTINFENMVFEDALTIISYASAYPITLEVQKSDPINIKINTSKKRADNRDGGSMLDGIRAILNSSEKNPPIENSSKWTPNNKPPLFHPLFKSQSAEDVSNSNYSNSLSPFSRVFDSIDATLESSRRSKSLQHNFDLNLANESMEMSRPKSRLCSLEVIEETPNFVRPSPPPLPSRNRIEDTNSVSSASSTSMNRVDPDSHAPDSTTITVTAEINAVDSRDEYGEITIQDPYAGLSYEERLQIIRLSYEDMDSRCTSQLTAIVDQSPRRRSQESAKSPSPTLDSTLTNGYELCHLNVPDDAASNEEEDISSTAESNGTASYECRRDRFPVMNNANASKARLNSLTSPSGSSIDASTTSSESSDRLSSPEHSKRDSGYDGHATNGNICVTTDDEIEKEQYEKLLYFQRQLAKQHEELARLGIHLPMAAGAVQHPTPIHQANRRPK